MSSQCAKHNLRRLFWWRLVTTTYDKYTLTLHISRVQFESRRSTEFSNPSRSWNQEVDLRVSRQTLVWPWLETWAYCSYSVQWFCASNIVRVREDGVLRLTTISRLGAFHDFHGGCHRSHKLIFAHSHMCVHICVYIYMYSWSQSAPQSYHSFFYYIIVIAILYIACISVSTRVGSKGSLCFRTLLTLVCSSLD